MSRIAYVNGRYAPQRDAAVNVEDRGYQFADGVYEVVYLRQGGFVDMDRHLGRLERSLDQVRIRMPMRRAALVAVLDEVARISPEGSAPPDPRDAAALIAMTELARGCPVGPPTAMFGAHTEDVATVDAALRPQLEAAVKAWSAPQLDVRKLIETGQAESLVLVASTCGTRVEDGATLGATATVVDGMARHASTDYGVTAEPFVAFDAAGVLVRAHARDAESARDFGLRLADAAARAFFVDTLPGGETTGADAGLTLLAQTLAPNHATWIEPFARTPSSRPPSQGSLDARASAMRRGPVRAVVVASADGAQADAMANALDRYMLRGEARTCASDAHADAPKPGSYVTVRPGPAEAYLALPVGPQCGHAADWLASLLRTDASLSHALAGTVRGSDARLVDAPSGRWLAVHLDAPNAALDAAVAQTRVLLARLHDGAITDGDLKAAQLTVDADLAKALVDPRLRAAAAWRKEPTKKSLPTLDAVLAALHLLFTTGHTAPAGADLVRADLVGRALDLARMLYALLPTPEAAGLLAMILLTDARRATRVGPDGRLLLLEEQDRGCWDRVALDEGRALVRDALRAGRPGPYALQAAIAAVHADAATWEQTDWPEIVGLYTLLQARWPSPVVALNRAVAIGMACGPEAGLAALQQLSADPALATYPYLPAVRADFLRRLGRYGEAQSAYEQALALTANDVERAFLLGRLSALG